MISCCFDCEQDCLSAYFETESIADFTCEKCQKQSATKQLRLRACPPVLTVVLKRFAKDQHSAWNTKNASSVAIPEIGLDLRQFQPEGHGNGSGSAINSGNSAGKHSLPAIDVPDAIAAVNDATAKIRLTPTRCSAPLPLYDLAAVACHNGSLLGGHCTALTKHPGTPYLSIHVSPQTMGSWICTDRGISQCFE